MASSFCLPKDIANKFKQSIKSGKIDIDKLSDMSSLKRRDFFTEMVGERNAREVNALFESKLLLKNQQRGMVTWAKQITGIRPELKNTLVDKIMKMEPILSVQEENLFFNDLASKRLGADITTKEAGEIVELSEKIRELENYKTDKERIKYGRAKIALTDYVSSLNPKKANLLTNIANVPRTVMTSIDLSAPLNQGWGMVSRKEFYKSLGPMIRYALNKENLLDLQADIITRENYKAAKKAGLRLTDLGDSLMQREEEMMSNILDKVPGIAASQRAYTGFLNKLRMDVFDSLVEKAKISGEDIGLDSPVLKDLASVVNNFTGGARVGQIETAVPALNAMFFSPRKVMSSINILNPRNYLSRKISKTARKAAIRNLLGSSSISVALISLANLLGSDEPERDPRSTNFGKIKVGDSRMDVTGGNGTYIVLLSRILSRSSKTSKGKIRNLGNKMYETSAWDLISRGVRYKLAPNASLLVDMFTGANAIGQKKTIPQSIKDRFKPMFIRDLFELNESDPDGKIALALLALFGANLNTYSTLTHDEDKQSFMYRYAKALKYGDIEEKNKIKKDIKEFNRKNKRRIGMSEISRLARIYNKNKRRRK